MSPVNNSELEILPQWRQDPEKMWGIYNEMLTDILSTDQPIPEIMDEAQAKVDEVLKK